jgi:hypothetical protein
LGSLVEHYYANPLNPMVGLNCCPGRVRLTRSFDPAFNKEAFFSGSKPALHFISFLYGAFTLNVKSLLNENLGGILGGTQC